MMKGGAPKSKLLRRISPGGGGGGGGKPKFPKGFGF
jgi:hypothetical protein